MFRIPGYSGTADQLWQLLPLENGLVETCKDGDGIEHPRPVVLEGIYWPESFDAKNHPQIQVCDGQYALNTKTGIVEFARPVVKLFTSASGLHMLTAAELYLTVAHGVKDKTTRVLEHFSSEHRLSGRPLGTGPHLVHRDDVVRTVIGKYQGKSPSGSPTDNLPTVANEATASLDAALDEFKIKRTAEIEYAGIVPIAPDGAIQQVVWAGGLEGGTTKAGRNHEFSLVVPSFKERRAAEKQRAAPANERRNAERTVRKLKGGR